MMPFVSECNIPKAYRALMILMGWDGTTEIAASRNGRVRTLLSPTAVEVRQPWERVLLDPVRDANPVFHLMESLWMLAGRRDVAFPAQFNSNIANYSDDGENFHGAYGYRWRNHFVRDQLLDTVARLKKDPRDRRAVLAMWDATVDGNGDGLDYPCNLNAVPRVRQGKLDLTTMNRSNDLIWGLMGANAVHMTILQEWLAGALGLDIGKWFHVTTNLHIYEQHWHLLPPKDIDFRQAREWGWCKDYPKHLPLLQPGEAMDFLLDCADLCDGAEDHFRTTFFDLVVAPMVQSWYDYKKGDKESALALSKCIKATDWRIAATQWYERRMK